MLGLTNEQTAFELTDKLFGFLDQLESATRGERALMVSLAARKMSRDDIDALNNLADALKRERLNQIARLGVVLDSQTG